MYHPRLPEALQRRRGCLRIVAIMGLLLCSVTVAVGVAEVIVRVLEPQQLIQVRLDLWQPAESIGYLHRPNAAVTMNTGERTVTVRTDHDGFRIGVSGRDSASRQLLLIGDSFMEALQVEHEQTTAHLLQRGIESAIGDRMAVRNAGIAGWEPNHYRIRAQQLLARERYDLVVVSVYVGNDAVAREVESFAPREEQRWRRFRLPRSLSSDEIIESLFAPVNDFLETRSHLFVLLRANASTLRMRLGLTADYFPVEFKRSEVQSPRWSVTAKILRDIEVDAARNGTGVLYVLIPAPFQVYSDDFTGYLDGFGIDPSTASIDQPSDRLREEMLALGLDVVDALPSFRAAASTGERLYGRVDNHLSPRGHEVLAGLLVPHAVRALRRDVVSH